MTGDPREIVHQMREGQRNKSRTHAEKTNRNHLMDQELKKQKLQNGYKNYLPFQDQEKLRKGYKNELLRRNTEFLNRQIAEKAKLKSKNKKIGHNRINNNTQDPKKIA